LLTFCLAAGVPQNLIVFGEKECTWNEDDLIKHEEKVNEFLAKVPKDKDYWTVMQEQNLPNAFLHIHEKLCKKEGCKHKFTKETEEDYVNLMFRVLN
jgi:CRISPR/Cas system-associated endonuclease/helicase Cas3